MSENKIWNVLELLNTTTEYFNSKNIENPRLNAEQLLGKVLQKSRVDLYMSFERPVSVNELADFRTLVKRRSTREPLQYILGRTEFMGLSFNVNPAVLIPRPETEVLVEEVLQLKETFHGRVPLIVDIGTGSGCIPVSLAHFWRDARYLALDISNEALQVAEENARLNEMNGSVEFVQHDILQTWPQTLPDEIQILISNPPYIAQDEMQGLEPELLNFEPHIALSDNSNGLTFYKRLFDICASDEAPRCEYLFLEMSGVLHREIFEMANHYKFTSVEVKNDLTNIPRVLKVKV